VSDLDPADLRWIAEACEPRTALMQKRYDAMVARRRQGEPLQYVLGSWGFRTLDLLVDRRVLIPRPETEWVVEHALRRVADGEPVTVLDLGTGSGAIALSIAVERAHARVVATDASPEALAVARANLAGIGRAGTRVELRLGDWWYAVGDERFDLVVSNPPYVAPADELPPEVANWEPRAALVPGPTGLEALDVVIAGAPAHIRSGGWLVCEIGETQGDAVRQLAVEAGFVDVDVLPDLTGRDRVLVARRPS
jgi:release factor glutamine methyltransferase